VRGGGVRNGKWEGEVTVVAGEVEKESQHYEQRKL
jgi:hypothetical protein